MHPRMAYETTHGSVRRAAKHAKRDVVNAIFHIAATGSQWLNLPACYPHWSTVHRYHVTWSRDGTWQRVADRVRELVREHEARHTEPSVAVLSDDWDDAW